MTAKGHRSLIFAKISESKAFRPFPLAAT